VRAGPLGQQVPGAVAQHGAGPGHVVAPRQQQLDRRPAVAVRVQPLVQAVELGRDIYQELIEINSSHSGGGTTKVAQAARAHLPAAGFSPADAEVLEPFPQKGNLLARFKGTGAKRPLLQQSLNFRTNGCGAHNWFRVKALLAIIHCDPVRV
jgi:acetylornithine deacetylase/succinyl-diaminopimelate desuccinylase-like protein